MFVRAGVRAGAGRRLLLRCSAVSPAEFRGAAWTVLPAWLEVGVLRGGLAEHEAREHAVLRVVLFFVAG